MHVPKIDNTNVHFDPREAQVAASTVVLNKLGTPSVLWKHLTPGGANLTFHFIGLNVSIRFVKSNSHIRNIGVGRAATTEAKLFGSINGRIKTQGYCSSHTRKAR